MKKATLTPNQRDIFDRAEATILNICRDNPTAWVVDCPDSQTLIDLGFLDKVENSKFGNLIKVKLP